MRNVKFAVLAFALCTTSWRSAWARTFANDDLEELRRSVVTVIATKQAPDFDNPWQRLKVENERYLGVAVEAAGFLVPAAAVRDATHLVMEELGGDRRFPLEVAAADFEVNLALVRPVDRALWERYEPLEILTDAKPGDTVRVLNSRRLGRPTLFRAHITEATTESAATSDYQLLSFVLDIRGEDFGAGEPVLNGDALVALATDRTARPLRATSGTIIAHFLEGLKGASYRGFVDLGLVVNPLVGRERRKALGIREEGGVRVVRVKPTSPLKDKIAPNDVLLSVGGEELDDHGFIRDPRLGKVGFQAVVNRFFAGDMVALTVARGQTRMMHRVALPAVDSTTEVVPAYRKGGGEPHLIVGGVVLQEMSGPLLATWGAKWREEAPLAFLYARDAAMRAGAGGGERIIIMRQVLADPINHGFELLNNAVVATVNGVPATSLSAVERALKERAITRHGERYLRIELAADRGMVVLPYAKLKEAHARIAASYGVRGAESFFQPGVR